MSSAPKLAKYNAPSGYPYYSQGYGYNAGDEANTARSQNLQGISDSQSQFAQQYPALQDATKRYAQNVSDQQYDATGAIANAQTNATYSNLGASGRSTGQAGQQAAESAALSGLGNTASLTSLLAGRTGLNASGQASEAAGLAGTTATANQKYAQNPSWNALQQQGLNQTNDATYQSIKSKGAGMISGTNTISPLLQQQMMQAGLQAEGQSMGATALGSGTQGQMGIARNLGLDLNQYVTDQQKQGQSLLGTANDYQGAGLKEIQSSLEGKTSDLSNYTNLQSNQRSNAAQQLSEGQSEQSLTQALREALTRQQSASSQAAQQGQALTASEQQQAYNEAQGIASSAQTANVTAQGTYPHQQVDLPGSAVVSLDLQNKANDYSSAQGGYAAQVQNAAYAANQQNQQAGLNAQASGQNMQAAGTAASIAATAAVAYCWVARSVYGWHDPRWQTFRHWLLLDAPRWFRAWYLRHGRAVARFLDAHPFAKAPVRLALNVLLERASIAHQG